MTNLPSILTLQQPCASMHKNNRNVCKTHKQLYVFTSSIKQKRRKVDKFVIYSPQIIIVPLSQILQITSSLLLGRCLFNYCLKKKLVNHKIWTVHESARVVGRVAASGTLVADCETCHSSYARRRIDTPPLRNALLEIPKSICTVSYN